MEKMYKQCYWSGLECNCQGGQCRDPFFDDPDFTNDELLADGGIEGLVREAQIPAFIKDSE